MDAGRMAQEIGISTLSLSTIEIGLRPTVSLKTLCGLEVYAETLPPEEEWPQPAPSARPRRARAAAEAVRRGAG